MFSGILKKKSCFSNLQAYLDAFIHDSYLMKKEKKRKKMALLSYPGYWVEKLNRYKIFFIIFLWNIFKGASYDQTAPVLKTFYHQKGKILSIK